MNSFRTFGSTDLETDPDTLAAAFADDGFLVFPELFDHETCNRLMQRAAGMIDAFDPAGVATVFSTTSVAHAATDYFRQSGDRISFFLEEGAVNEAGHLTRDKALAINKIGHAMHDLDPVFSSFCRQKVLAALAKVAGLRDPKLLQSMYICKQPQIGGEVVCHQDSTFLYTKPLSCIGFWVALEDATLENGCLQTLPGRHRDGLKAHFHDVDGLLVTETLEDTPWPMEEAVALEVPRGTLIVLHGCLPHLSGPNHSDRSRHAFTLHLIDGMCDYPGDNWLQRGAGMPLFGFETPTTIGLAS